MNLVKNIKASYDELVNKVSWPTWSELMNSAVVVLIASVIIAAIVAVMDISFEKLMDFIYGLF
jgi:preprotein translocase subunit SecE